MRSRYSGWVTATTRTLRPRQGSISLAMVWPLARTPMRTRSASSGSSPGSSLSTPMQATRRCASCAEASAASVAGCSSSAASSSKGLTRVSKSWRPWISTGTPSRASSSATSGIRLAWRRAPL